MKAERIIRYGSAVFAGCFLAAAAAAADNVSPIQFSGFGTVGAVVSHEDDADYRANSEQAQGVGNTSSPDYGVDSVFGVQADASPIDRVSFSVQMQSRRLSDGGSSPYFEWANAKFMITPDMSVRLGRVVAPVFMVSESRSIGYAQTTVRLAPDVYQLAPITYLDGGGFTYSFTWGDWLYRANLTSGDIEQKLTVSGELRDYSFTINIFNIEAELENSRFRISYSDVDAELRSPTISLLDSALTAFAAAGLPNADILRENIDFYDNQVGFVDLGYVYEQGPYFAQMEIVHRDAESETIQDQEAYYLLGGYRVGRWMPYLQYSRMESKIDESHLPALDASQADPSNQTFVTKLNGGIAAIRRPQERTTWAMGARWDIQDNYAIKLQYDRISKDADRLSYFVNPSGNFVAEARTINIYSATLDFVF